MGFTRCDVRPRDLLWLLHEGDGLEAQEIAVPARSAPAPCVRLRGDDAARGDHVPRNAFVHWQNISQSVSVGKDDCCH
eukprot:7461869-Pyramimonas_sp.AAC.2